MTGLAPWQTVAPAVVSAVLLGIALVLGRRELRVPWGWPLLAWVVLALGVRLWLLPALGAHEYDGHEAEYFDLFLGTRAPTRGGTVLYPAMQWWWWGLGRLLPHNPAVPVVISALVGTLGAGLIGATVGRLCTRGAGWIAATLVALHPVHAAWSSSAYNVVLPAALGALCLWAGVAVLTRRQVGGWLPWIGALAGALAVATRLEAGLWGLLVVLLALVLPAGAEGARAWRSRLVLVPPALLGTVLGLAAAWPLLHNGELPGEGERALSFAMNRGWLAPWTPFDAVPMVALVLGGGLLALGRWPRAGMVLLAWPLVVHLGMATFDDYGDRHVLVGLVGIAWCVGAGGVALAQVLGRLGLPEALAGVLPVFVGLGLALGLVQLRERYYAPQEDFQAWLDSGERAELPRWDPGLARLQRTPEGGFEACGLVAEDERVAAEPPLSHFNLLDPAEAASLRGAGGCLRWCMDLQDRRWSSRGVHDRALRLSHLYELQAIAVVEEPSSGYACLVYEVGARRCCYEPR